MVVLAVAGWAGRAAPVSATATTGFHFHLSRFETYESAGFAVITVERESYEAAQGSVEYSTADGTATAGSDYVATSGVLTFAVGETARSFTIPIIDDNRHEPAEDLEVDLGRSQGSVGDNGDPATVVIGDDDPLEPGSIARPAAMPPGANPESHEAADVTDLGGQTRPIVGSIRARRARRAAAVVRTFRLDTPAFAPPAASSPSVDIATVVLAALLLGNVAARLWFARRRAYPDT